MRARSTKPDPLTAVFASTMPTHPFAYWSPCDAAPSSKCRNPRPYTMSLFAVRRRPLALLPAFSLWSVMTLHEDRYKRIQYSCFYPFSIAVLCRRCRSCRRRSCDTLYMIVTPITALLWVCDCSGSTRKAVLDECLRSPCSCRLDR